MTRIGEGPATDRQRTGGVVLLFAALITTLAVSKGVNPPVERNARGVIAPEFAYSNELAETALRNLVLLSDKAQILYRETKADIQNPETFDPNRSVAMKAGDGSGVYTVTVDGVEPSLPLRNMSGQVGAMSAAYEVDASMDNTGALGVTVEAAVVGNGGTATMYSYDIGYADGGVTMRRHFATSDGATVFTDDVNMYAGNPWADTLIDDTSCATSDSIGAFMAQADDMLTNARAGNPVPAPPIAR